MQGRVLRSSSFRSSSTRIAQACFEALEGRTYFGYGVNGIESIVTDCGCGGDMIAKDPNGDKSDKVGRNASPDPVIYADGRPIYNSVDLVSNEFGKAWGITRSWTALNESSQMGNGWMVESQPYLLVKQNNIVGVHPGIIALVAAGQHIIDFVQSGAGFVTKGTSGATLTYASGEFKVTDVQGNVTTFYDLPRSSGNINGASDYAQKPTGSPAFRYGAFKGYTDASGNYAITPTYDSSSGNLTKLVRTDGSGKYEALNYHYSTVTNSTTSASASLIDYVTLDKGTSSSGPWTTIRKASYEYYTGTISGGTRTDEDGRLGDLKTVTITDYLTGSPIEIDHKYYRYYKFHTFASYAGSGHVGPTNLYTGNNDQNSGGTGGADTTFLAAGGDNAVASGLKAIVEGTSLSRLQTVYDSFDELPDYDADPGTDADGDGISDNDDIRSFANNFFTYRSAFRADFAQAVGNVRQYLVKEELAAASGCSTCSGGFGLTRLEYVAHRPFLAVADPYEVTPGIDASVWAVKTTEYLPDTTNTPTVQTSSTITSSSTTATVSWTAHGFSIGDEIYVTGANQSQYNGTFYITTVSTDSFTYTIASSATSPATGSITVTNRSAQWKDNDQNIVYTNEMGQVMATKLVDRNGTVSTADDKEYITYYHFDIDGRLTEVVHPSAMLALDESKDDLVDWDNGASGNIRPSGGLIEGYVYAESTTATSSTAGDVTGYFERSFVQRGLSGMPIWTSSQQYYDHTDSSDIHVYPIATTTTYDDLAHAVARTTTHSYTWYSGTNRIASDTVTLPTIAEDQNGSGSANQRATFFDEMGRRVWIKDANGAITYNEYDDKTGVVTKQIVDVDTTQTGDFSNKPSGWSSSGQHLITLREVDDFGRTTKVTDPNGNITYTVYNDSDHEVRRYRGWTGSTTTGAIEVTREYRPAPTAASGKTTVFTETLISSATPTVSSGKPTGQETFDSTNILSLSRSIKNDAGQVIETDAYFSLAGATYDAETTRLGSASNDSSSGNYHATLTDYDGQGRLKRTVSPTGTITRTLYDARGNVTSVWVGTDDTPTSGFWSPSNTTGTDLVKVAENEYDYGAGGGDGVITETTQYPGGGASERVTQNFYDWRDRLVVTKSGAEGSESTSTQRPLSYFEYDNQGRVLVSNQYDGDDVDLPVVDNSGSDFLNSSFETVGEDFTSGIIYVPADTDWSYGGGAGEGVVSAGSEWEESDPSTAAPSTTGPGDRMAFIEAGEGNSITQDVNFSAAGTYVISFDAAKIAAYGDFYFDVYVDSQLIMSDAATSSTFSTFISAPFNVSSDGTLIIEIGYDEVSGSSPAIGVFDHVKLGVLSLFNEPDPTLLRARQTFEYDAQGRQFASHVFSIEPSDGDISSDSLDTYAWYDAEGRVIKRISPGAPVVKQTYDGAGRLTKSYVTDGGGDAAPGASGTLSDADDVSGDTVLSQTEYTYDDNGNLLLTATKDRFHDTSGTGELQDLSTTPKARTSYVRSYYDALDRTTATVNVGTNGGSSYTSSTDASVPSRSDTKLVTSYTYSTNELQTIEINGAPTGGSFILTFDGQTTASIAYNASAATVDSELEALSNIDSGEVTVTAGSASNIYMVEFTGGLALSNVAQLTATSSLTGGTSPSVSISTQADGSKSRLSQVTDPRGIATITDYDLLGRTKQVTEAYTDGASSSADDRKTAYTYNGNGDILTMKSLLPGGTFQETAYIYGVSTGSDVTSNDLLAEIRYPDKSTGSASSSEMEVFTTNALGERTTYTDRNGSVHTYSYDVLGRLLSDAVPTLGGGLDNDVLRIQYGYNTQGLLEKISSYNASSSGTIVNEIKREYNGLGQLITEYQDHSGSVDGSEPAVHYAYSEMNGGANHSRLTSITYPNGRIVRYEYGTSSNLASDGVNDTISRLTYLADDSSGSIGVHLEEYEYLGIGTVVARVHPEPDVNLTYIKDSGDTVVGDAGDQYKGLDRFGRIIDQRWATSGGTDKDRWKYGYDRNSNPLYRDNQLDNNFDELYHADGTSAGYDNLNRLVEFQRGSLSDANSDGVPDTVSSSSRTQIWTLDAVGNMDSVSTNGTPESRTHNLQNQLTIVGGNNLAFDSNGNLTTTQAGKTLVYDAWNRLTAQKNGASTEVSYKYDGTGRRVGNTVSGTTTEYYFSDAWQIVEETVSGTTRGQYVWSPTYVNAMVLRDRDSDSNGSLEERIYPSHDANYNVTSLVSTGGSTLERFVYDPYGSRTVLAANWAGTSDSYEFSHGFQGGKEDAVTGLINFQRRDFSVQLSRWVQQDYWFGYLDGSNLYQFALSNPLTHIDPSGAGSIIFQNCTECGLLDFVILSEDMRDGTITMPAPDVLYPDVDGVWNLNWDREVWFKIPNHCDAVYDCSTGQFTATCDPSTRAALRMYSYTVAAKPWDAGFTNDNHPLMPVDAPEQEHPGPFWWEAWDHSGKLRWGGKQPTGPTGLDKWPVFPG
jgi:RHS repeat-associated protein